jgi:hypothetical protein
MEYPVLFNHKARWRDGVLLIIMLSTLVFQPVGYRQGLRDGDLLIMMLGALVSEPVGYR